MPDDVDALSKLAIAQGTPGGVQGRFYCVELMQYLFTGCVRFNHADDGAQVPLGGSQPVYDRFSRFR